MRVKAWPAPLQADWNAGMHGGTTQRSHQTRSSQIRSRHRQYGCAGGCTSAVPSCTVPGSGTPQRRMAARSGQSAANLSWRAAFSGRTACTGAFFGDWLRAQFLGNACKGFAFTAFVAVTGSIAHHTVGCDAAWHGLCNCPWGHPPEF